SLYHLNSELSGKVGPVPVSVQGSFVVNDGAVIASGDQKIGYQFGTIIGKASAANTYEAAYFYKYIETDATLADINDSDFGDNGGTNRKGHIFWIAYNPRAYLQFKAKWFLTETVHAELQPGRKEVNRMQLDVMVKF